MDVYTHDKGQDFKKLPEVSNVEVCSACNLQCPMCLRTTHLGRQPGLISMELLKTMHKRGDFEGTFYTELQMAGEPTLHPKLWDIIQYLKHEVGIMVGMSTHGLNMEKGSVDVALIGLDALTISVDSVNPDVYHKMRFPAHLPDLYKSLDKFFELVKGRVRYHKSIPMIELQLVKTSLVDNTGDIDALQKVMEEKGWDQYAVVRTIDDCFEGMQDRATSSVTGLCLNPFTSVSIAHNGDVVSCCMIFTPNKSEVNYYGNLHEQSLQEIWESDRVRRMRDMMLGHAHMGFELLDQCKKCTVRSPCTIHSQIVSRLVQLKYKGIQSTESV